MISNSFSIQYKIRGIPSFPTQLITVVQTPRSGKKTEFLKKMQWYYEVNGEKVWDVKF